MMKCKFFRTFFLLFALKRRSLTRKASEGYAVSCFRLLKKTKENIGRQKKTIFYVFFMFVLCLWMLRSKATTYKIVA